MHMLYNSDSFAVMQIVVPLQGEGPAGDVPPSAVLARGGFEIVDKATQREIYIEGALAEGFQRGVEALVESGQANPEAFDDFIAGYAVLAQQPLVLH